MENKQQNTQKRPYEKPEAELVVLRIQENIAISGAAPIVVHNDEFDGEDDVFD